MKAKKCEKCVYLYLTHDKRLSCDYHGKYIAEIKECKKKLTKEVVKEIRKMT